MSDEERDEMRFEIAAQHFLDFFTDAQAMKSLQIRKAFKKEDAIDQLVRIFHLIDAWTERDKHRVVYKFKLVAVEGDEDLAQPVHVDAERRRIIPTTVKLEVWKRDGGKCRFCEAVDELHFDHILPFSKGGTSLTAENVQLLCARHNIQKRDSIQ